MAPEVGRPLAQPSHGGCRRVEAESVALRSRVEHAEVDAGEGGAVLQQQLDNVRAVLSDEAILSSEWRVASGEW